MRRTGWTLVGLLALVALALAWQLGWLPVAPRHAAHTPARGSTALPDSARSAAVPSDDSAPRRAVDPVLRTRTREAEIIGRFDTWAARWMTEPDPATRAATLAQGLTAAAARRTVLHDLIASDPERALSHAAPWGIRRALPPEVQALLETRVDGVGSFHAIASFVAPSASSAPTASGPSVPATRREVVLDGQTYQAFPYGRRLELGSRSRLAVHGIALDGRLALLDSPVRVLDPGEPVASGRRIEETCAISGLQPEPAAAIPADTGDRVIYLCSAGHIDALASQLEPHAPAILAAGGSSDSSSGAAAPAPPAAVPVQGALRVLMIRVRFADQPAWFQPDSQQSAEAMFGAATDFYRENSGGTLHIEGTVSPVYALPQTAAWYAANDLSGYALNVLQAARAVAADPASVPGNDGLAALDYLDYDLEAVRYTTGPGSFSGQGFVAMRGCWIKSADPGVLIHELGHNLGLWHANAWTPADALVPLGPGANLEYGDTFDTMGPSRGGAWHFNTWEKHHLGWLPAESVTPIASSARVTLAPHDLGPLPSPGAVGALRIRRDSERDCWIELRRHSGWLAAQPSVHQGLGLRWDPWSRSNGGTQLIDTTPGSPFGRDDATLAIGRTFSDLAAGIHITPIGPSNLQPGALEVDVRLAPSSANRPPSVTVSASALEVAPGQTVQFSATAVDPDGDALSYAWTFDDSGASVPGALVTYAWSAGGDQRAQVTVSDRQGGTASASILVRVGTAIGSRLSGRVLDLAGQPIAGVLVTNGTEPGADEYRAAWSDSDGTFTLLRVPPGTWNLAATAPGWIFAIDGFSRPVNTPVETGGVTILGCWKGFTISGTLRQADGTPISGAIVRTGQRAEPTDYLGEFALTGLSPGRHILAVEGTTSIIDPFTVELGLGDVTSVYLTEKTFTVSGVVEGGSATAVTVTTGWQSTTATGEGAPALSSRPFKLAGVPAGTWTVRALAASGAYPAMGYTPPVQVDRDTTGIALAGEARPGAAISGLVSDRGLGVPGASVTVGNHATTTDSRGGYWIAGLEPGTYAVSVTAPGLQFLPPSRTVGIGSLGVAGVDFTSDRVNEAPTLAQAAPADSARGQPFITLHAEATDDDGASLLRYWWSVIGDAPGDVAFSTDGANAARETVARFSAPGAYHLRVTAVDRHGAHQSADLTVQAASAFSAPSIVEPARADPAVVGASLETVLTMRASSEAGDDHLVYTWASLAPDGSLDSAAAPGPVTFSANATNAARETIARFRHPGNYLFRVVARDPVGQTVESTVAVRVEHTYDAWMSRHFDPQTLADPAARATIYGELADPDGDSVVNLLEYAFGGDPMLASADARPRTHFVTEGGAEYLAVTFRPNPDAIDLVFEPQVSSDLDQWQAGLIFVPGPDEKAITYRDFAPAAEHQKRFIRVNVTRAEK